MRSSVAPLQTFFNYKPFDCVFQYKLKQKIVHRGSLINWIFGATVILAIVLTVIIGDSGNIESAAGMIAVLWYGIGTPVWIVWRIALIIKSKLKSYCMNIQHI